MSSAFQDSKSSYLAQSSSSICSQHNFLMQINEQQHGGHPLGRHRWGRGGGRALFVRLSLQSFASERQKSDHVENDTDFVDNLCAHQLALLKQQCEQVNPENSRKNTQILDSITFQRGS